MDIEVLLDHNPWWRDKTEIEEDFDIKKWQNNRYRWVPDVVEEIPLNGFSLHFLLGPRQVGKTTAVKLIIKRLLENTDSKSVFYFRCDELSDYKELKEVLTSYLAFREENGIKKSFMFLDEVTSPREWFRAVKSLIDGGKFENDVLVLTGSNTLSVKKHIDS